MHFFLPIHWVGCECRSECLSSGGLITWSSESISIPKLVSTVVGPSSLSGARARHLLCQRPVELFRDSIDTLVNLLDQL